MHLNLQIISYLSKIHAITSIISISAKVTTLVLNKKTIEKKEENILSLCMLGITDLPLFR